MCDRDCLHIGQLSIVPCSLLSKVAVQKQFSQMRNDFWLEILVLVLQMTRLVGIGSGCSSKVGVFGI